MTLTQYFELCLTHAGPMTVGGPALVHAVMSEVQGLDGQGFTGHCDVTRHVLH